MLYFFVNFFIFVLVFCFFFECFFIFVIEGFLCDFCYLGVCVYEYCYGDLLSFKGVFVYESVIFDGIKIDKVVFGCGSDN